MPDHLLIDDPDAIRTMTNPIRFLAVTELYTTQSAYTATELAILCGVSPSSMSYHLRKLENHGIVARSPGTRDGRQRPWMAAARTYTLDAAGDVEPADRTRLLDTYLEPVKARMQGVLARRAQLPESRRDQLFTVLATGELLLTEDELLSLKSESEQLWRRYEEIGWKHERAGEPEGTDAEPTVRAVYLWSVVPDNPGLFNIPDSTDPATAASGTGGAEGGRRRS